MNQTLKIQIHVLGVGLILADVDWGDGVVPLPFNQVKINE